MTAEVTRAWSGGPWEQRYGYCRALRSGDRVIVSGCTAAADPSVLDTGGKGGRIPELWDGRCAERIAAHLHDWLLRGRAGPPAEG